MMKTVVRLLACLAIGFLEIHASVRAEQGAGEVPKSTDSEDRVYSLLGHGSSVELRTFHWVGEDQLLVRFSFQTRSYQGQLLRLIATGQDRQPVLEIRTWVSKRTIRVFAEDFVDQSDKTTTIHFPDADVSKGQYHQLSITIDPNGDLLAEFDGVSRAGKVGLRKTVAPLDTTLYIGGNPGGPTADVHSVIGCVGKFSVGYGPIKVSLIEERREGDIDDGCLDACAGSSCAKYNPAGLCLNNYLEPICDCVGTHMEGPFCHLEPKVYHFDGDQYITYELGHHEYERQPRRLHVSFKAEPGDTPMLLLYASLASDSNTKEALTVIVNKDSIEIRLRGVSLLKTPTKHELSNARWHDLTLEIDYPKTELTLKLDSERFKSTEWSNTDSDVSFREIYFGGYKNEEVAKSFKGCLRTAFIDYTPISRLILGEKVRFGKEPLDGSCRLLADFEDDKKQGTTTAKQASTSTAKTTVTEIPTEANTSAASSTTMTTSTAQNKHHDSEDHDHDNDEGRISPFLDERPASPKTTQQPMVTCADSKCQHGTRCIEKNSGSGYCDCKGSGYVGKLCQFSNLPKTCDELFETGEDRNGVFRIDPDGDGPIEPVFVKCEFSESDGGITYVDHNFVNGTYVRQADKKDTTYSVIYRNMSIQALQTLSASSEKCEQYIKFECNQAPLFLHNSTWFKSALRQEAYSTIGGATDDKQCPCGRQKSCVPGKCSCDVGDKQTRSDEGVNIGQLAGITELTVLQNSATAGWAKVALGPLMCKGSKRSDDVVQFRNRGAVLRFSAWKGRKLSFWFRTSIKAGRLFSQGSSSGRYLNLDLEEGHALIFYSNFRKDKSDVAVVTRLVSQSPINDAAWHRVKVEASFNEIRFSIDDKVDAFYSLTPEDSLNDSSFDREFIFGGADDIGHVGYVGCVRQLILNDDVVRLNSDNPAEGIASGCQSHCSSEERCFNNAECIEDYENGGFQCKCVNEYTFLGPYCQIDINKGTEVSFQKNAHILVRDFAVDPVSNNRLVFSFRTDQTSALLLFGHDDKYNMIQIHLMDGNRISLTVNYEKELRQCTIVKKGGDLNDMQWLQVVVLYAADHTSLFVDKDTCQISGGRRLSTEYLEEWDGDIPKLRVVYPPRPPVRPSQMPAYSLLHVGGVRRQPRQRMTRQSRQIVYTSPLPNLLGCLRGFMVGQQQLDLRSANKSGSVKHDCNVGCNHDQLRCEYGGYCKVNWDTDQRSICDCVPTSYFGPRCTRDHGLHFDGSTFVQVQLELILQRLRLPEERSYDSLSFAFSTTWSSTGSQLLAYIQVNPEKDLRVSLTEGGQLVMESREPDQQFNSNQTETHGPKSHIHAFSRKVNDGQRHFVFLKFFGDKLVVRIDRQYHESHRIKWRLSDTRKISFGGANIIDNSSSIYTGCMSNALVEFRSSTSQSLKPFDDLLNPRGVWHESYQHFVPRSSRLDAAQCAQYTLENPMPTDGPVTALPAFTEPMQTFNYASTGAPPSKDGKGGGIGIAIGLAVVVIIVLLCIVLYLYYAKCVKSRRRRNPEYQPASGDDAEPAPTTVIPEKQVLLPSPDDTRSGHRNGPRNPPGLTELPEANEDLDEHSTRGSNAPNHRPLTSSSPPPPYVPTVTPPITPAAAKDSLQSIDLDTFPPAPTDEELKALTPTVRRNPSTKKGAFVYGFPNAAYEDSGKPPSPESPKPPLAPKPSLPRRMPRNVPIPKI